jgi:hypothetical protein
VESVLVLVPTGNSQLFEVCTPRWWLRSKLSHLPEDGSEWLDQRAPHLPILEGKFCPAGLLWVVALTVSLSTVNHVVPVLEFLSSRYT